MALQRFLLLILVSCAWARDVPELTDEAEFWGKLGTSSPQLILFTSNRAGCQSCRNIAPLWAEYTQSSPRPANAYRVDCGRLTTLCANLGVSRYPRIELFTEGKDESFIYYGNRQPKHLLKLVAERGDVPESVHIRRGLSHLTDKTYERHLAHGTHFVLLHAHWCSHCRAMLPAWEELALSLLPNPTLDIAIVECETHRSVCQSFGVKGYPTILLVENGAVKQTYHGARDYASLAMFLYKAVGRPDAPGQWAVSSVDVQRETLATVARFRTTGSGVAPKVSLDAATLPPLALTGGGNDGGATSAAFREFRADLVKWVLDNQDARGSVNAKALLLKIKELRAQYASDGSASQEMDVSPDDNKLVSKLQAMLKERGINAQVKTLKIDTRNLAAGKKTVTPPSTTTRQAARTPGSGAPSTAEDGAVANPGDGDQDLTPDESISALQQELEAELNDKIRRHLANGDITPAQAAAVKQFVGQVQGAADEIVANRDAVAAAGGVGGGNAAHDPLAVDVAVAGLGDNVLTPEDVREIREAVMEEMETEQHVPGQQKPTLAETLELTERKLQKKIQQRLQQVGQMPEDDDRQASSLDQSAQENYLEQDYQDEYFNQESPEQYNEQPLEEDGLNLYDTGVARDEGLDAMNGQQAGHAMHKEDSHGMYDTGGEAETTTGRMATGSVSADFVVELTLETFNDIAASGPVFVCFYAPWCKHCKTFESVWRELSMRLAGVSGITIAKFNCDKHKEFCQEKDIPSFPELVLFKSPRQQIHYSGLRTADSFYHYVLNHVPNLQQADGTPLQLGQGNAGATVEVNNMWYLSDKEEFAEAASTPVAFILFTHTACELPLCRTARLNADRLSNSVQDDDVAIAQVDCWRSSLICDANLLAKHGHGWVVVYKDGKETAVQPIVPEFSAVPHFQVLLKKYTADANADTAKKHAQP